MLRKLLSFQCHLIWLFLLVCIGKTNTSGLDRSLSFTLISKKNQTGHRVTEFLLDKSSEKLPDLWKLSIDHKVTEYGGIQTFHLGGIYAAPPTRPRDYELFPGVGYYKFHTEIANGFEDASSICSREGGHLAIVNSESEHQVLQAMFARHLQNDLNAVWAFVGFHDRLKEGEYVTIFGQPLNSTGFTRWSGTNQPDNNKGVEHCGSVHRNGGYNDIRCTSKLPFFCEYDLSWMET